MFEIPVDGLITSPFISEEGGYLLSTYIDAANNGAQFLVDYEVIEDSINIACTRQFSHSHLFESLSEKGKITDVYLLGAKPMAGQGTRQLWLLSEVREEVVADEDKLYRRVVCVTLEGKEIIPVRSELEGHRPVVVVRYRRNC